MAAKRLEFSKPVKARRFAHCKGRCEQCGDKLIAGHEYDHDIAAGIGGKADFENCRVLCIDCHYVKTYGEGGDNAKMRRADRLSANKDVKRTSKYVMAGSRSSKWKKKLDGTVIRRVDK